LSEILKNLLQSLYYVLYMCVVIGFIDSRQFGDRECVNEFLIN